MLINKNISFTITLTDDEAGMMRASLAEVLAYYEDKNRSDDYSEFLEKFRGLLYVEMD